VGDLPENIIIKTGRKKANNSISGRRCAPPLMLGVRQKDCEQFFDMSQRKERSEGSCCKQEKN